MARSRDPFGLTLSALRQQLRDGAFAPGAPMIITDIAQHLKVSTTPVREALSRLAGEDLVADDPARGYHTHKLGAGEIEDLFELHHAYAQAALRWSSVRSRQGFSVADDLVPETAGWTPQRRRARAERFFDRLVEAGENQIMAKAHAVLADRLAPLRLIESSVLEQIDGEIEGLEAGVKVGDEVQLSALLDLYHNRRIAASKVFVSALRAGPNIRSI